MSFEAFKEAINNNAELKQALLKRCEEEKPADEAAKQELLVAFAREHGFEITDEDLILMRAEQKDLDEKELSLVSGGKVKSNCDFNYACSFAFNSCAFCNECYNNHSCLENAGDYCRQIFLTPDMKR